VKNLIAILMLIGGVLLIIIGSVLLALHIHWGDIVIAAGVVLVFTGILLAQLRKRESGPHSK
jgi:hypothetical protein